MSTVTTKLILIRHGQTTKTTTGKMHTADSTETLSKNGQNQIQKAANLLKTHKPSALYSSKESHANESAAIISEVCGVKLVPIDNLEERNWGKYAGKDKAEIKLIMDRMTPEERYEYTPKNGESWKTFETRLKKVIDKLIKKHSGKTIVVVTHGGAIRAVMPYLMALPKEESFNFDPDNASLTIFEHDGKKFKEIMFSDTTHLD